MEGNNCLSIEERCQHNLWKIRVSGYEDAAKLFNQLDEKSPEFKKYLCLLRKFVADSDADAQEKGLMAVLAFVENAECAPKAVNVVVRGLVSRCFSSQRPNTRSLAVEIILMYFEIEKQAVLEELIIGLENISPKVVFNCLVTLRAAIHLFGLQVNSIKPLLKLWPQLYESREKSIREESKYLYVEIYRWFCEALRTHRYSRKLVILLELENEFQSTSVQRMLSIGYLKSQLEQTAKENDKSEVRTTESFNSPAVVELMNAFDMLPNISRNFNCQNKRTWKYRRDVLEALLPLTKNSKLKTHEHGELIRVLERIITKESIVLNVSLAVKCLNNLIQGLRKNFLPHADAIIPVIFEKFKEKKKILVAPLREVIDSIYTTCGFEAMLEDIKSALDNKNPQIKAETCAFLSRAFATCTAAQLNYFLWDFKSSLLKALNDYDVTVRENAAEALGIALKVVGERIMSEFLHEVDSIKMAKIKDFCDTAEVEHSVTIEKKRKPVEAKNTELVKQTAAGINKSATSEFTKFGGNASAALSDAKTGESDFDELYS